MNDVSPLAARIGLIRVESFRNLQSVELHLADGFNFFSGGNGAGKTSVLEAVHVLGHGRSFRTAQAGDLVRVGRDRFSIFAECRLGPAAAGHDTRLGLGWSRDGWTLRRNNEAVPILSDFVRNLPVVTLDPGSHELISGPSELRRRFLDWLLFHVEPDFLSVWRRYARALRQRNAALRSPSGVSDRELSVWEKELVEAGTRVHDHRERLVSELRTEFLPLLASIAPGLPVEGIRLRSGWSSDTGLADALREGRSSDRERGFTQRGPHRGDWRLQLGNGLDHDQLSRGQGKLAALTSLLAQAALLRKHRGDWPVLSCDDLAAELDDEHQARLLEWLSRTGAQVLITGTSTLTLPTTAPPARMFHVEQGRIAQLL